MRTHLPSDANGKPVLGFTTAPKHDVFYIIVTLTYFAALVRFV